MCLHTRILYAGQVSHQPSLPTGLVEWILRHPIISRLPWNWPGSGFSVFCLLLDKAPPPLVLSLVMGSVHHPNMELCRFPRFSWCTPRKQSHVLDNAHTTSRKISKPICPHFLIISGQTHHEQGTYSHRDHPVALPFMCRQAQCSPHHPSITKDAKGEQN